MDPEYYIAMYQKHCDDGEPNTAYTKYREHVESDGMESELHSSRSGLIFERYQLHLIAWVLLDEQ